jgi:hypothetical protein
MPFLLIRPDEFDACQDFPLHCLFKLGLGWPTEVGKNSLESVELVELARIIHEGQGLRSADVREGGAWGAIGGVG